MVFVNLHVYFFIIIIIFKTYSYEVVYKWPDTFFFIPPPFSHCLKLHFLKQWFLFIILTNLDHHKTDLYWSFFLQFTQKSLFKNPKNTAEIHFLLIEKCDATFLYIAMPPPRSRSATSLMDDPYTNKSLIVFFIPLRSFIVSFSQTQTEPYDYASWSLILIFSVHATGSSILIFEWLSPYGLNRGLTPMRGNWGKTQGVSYWAQ